jgi:hypothetical protein
MTERKWNRPLFDNSHWDIRNYDECFSNGAALTDIDSTVERNGHFLILEFKGNKFNDDGSRFFGIPVGQYRLFLALQKLKVFTIYIIWGDVDYPEFIKALTENGDVIKPQSINQETLRALIKDWDQKHNGSN